MTTDLVEFSVDEQALAEIQDPGELKDWRDKAEAVRQYVKNQGVGLDGQNRYAEAKIWIERRLGQVLSDGPKNPGQLYRGSIVEPREIIPTLADLGIAKTQSHRWQTAAGLPEEMLRAYIAEIKSEDEELTSKGVYRLAQKLKQEQEREAQNIAPPTGLYRAIVIDPPWPVKKILREVRPYQDTFDYPTMTLDEIALLPVDKLADPDGCHLYLWVTQKFLPHGLMLLKDWGFKYQCLMTWVKPTGFTPFSWMYNTEHVIFGRRGNLKLDRNGLKLSFNASSGKHSTKPQVFYDRVVQASPEPRLELFARATRKGFVVWGDEINELDTK